MINDFQTDTLSNYEIKDEDAESSDMIEEWHQQVTF